MFLSKRSNQTSAPAFDVTNSPQGAEPPGAARVSPGDSPEERHRACWYSRRTPQLPDDPGFHTIADGQLLFCAHPMWFPVVGYQFDVASCSRCDYYKPVRRRVSVDG